MSPQDQCALQFHEALRQATFALFGIQNLSTKEIEQLTNSISFSDQASRKREVGLELIERLSQPISIADDIKIPDQLWSFPADLRDLNITSDPQN